MLSCVAVPATLQVHPALPSSIMPSPRCLCKLFLPMQTHFFQLIVEGTCGGSLAATQKLVHSPKHTKHCSASEIYQLSSQI